MSWSIIFAALAGIVVSYIFRYKVNDVYNFVEYVWFEKMALARGLVGAAVAIFLWAHVTTALGWFGIALDWPMLDWKIAAVVGFAGRKLYELAPQAFTYIAALFKKRFDV